MHFTGGFPAPKIMQQQTRTATKKCLRILYNLCNFALNFFHIRQSCIAFIVSNFDRRATVVIYQKDACPRHSWQTPKNEAIEVAREARRPRVYVNFAYSRDPFVFAISFIAWGYSRLPSGGCDLRWCFASFLSRIWCCIVKRKASAEAGVRVTISTRWRTGLEKQLIGHYTFTFKACE